MRRELAALAMLAVGLFATVSLISHHAGRAANLGGPVGDALASSLASLLGYDAYALIALIAVFASRIWKGAGWRTVAREVGAGVLILLAIGSAIGLWSDGDRVSAGQVGATLGNYLHGSINLGGGYLVA